jgi:pimeloyl-ACP methyl ester carboxylesterase
MHADTQQGAVEYAIDGDGPPVLVVHGTPGGSDQGLALGRFLAHAGLQVMHGSADTDVAPDHGEHASEAIAGGERVVLEGGTHLCLWTDPGAGPARARAAALLGAPDG